MAKKKQIVDTSDLADDDFIGMDYDTFKASIFKSYGERAIMTADTLRDPDPNFSGSLSLDLDLRIPFPAGRIIEVLGEEHSGKTTLSLEVLGQAQQAGKRVAYNNAERNLNRSLVDGIRTIIPEKLRILEGANGEENLQLVHKYVASFPNSVVVVDSVDAIVPEAVLEGAIGDSAVGNLAKLMSDACRKLKDICALNNSTVIFINQIREKITTYGDPRTESGGRALKFYSSQRVRLEAVGKADQIKSDKGDRVIGHNARYYIIKNKVAPPFIKGSFPLMYGKGVHREAEVAKLLKSLGLIQTGGPGGHSLRIDDGEKERVLSLKKAADLFESSPSLYQKYYDIIMNSFLDEE